MTHRRQYSNTRKICLAAECLLQAERRRRRPQLATRRKPQARRVQPAWPVTVSFRIAQLRPATWIEQSDLVGDVDAWPRQHDQHLISIADELQPNSLEAVRVAVDRMMILLKRLIKSGLPTGAMVVFALIAKFAWHLPLYRQNREAGMLGLRAHRVAASGDHLSSDLPKRPIQFSKVLWSDGRLIDVEMRPDGMPPLESMSRARR